MHSTVGDTYRNGQLYENTHQGIITKRERDKLIEILEKNKTGRRFIEQDDLFRRRVKCSQCGSIMSVNARSHNNYKTIHYSMYVMIVTLTIDRLCLFLREIGRAS